MKSFATATRAELNRARWALVVMFGLFGVIQMSWMGRIPSLREALGLSHGQLGTILVIGALGGFLGVLTIGAVTMRLGSRLTLYAGMAGSMIGMIGMALGAWLGSPIVFAGGLVFGGLFVAATNVPINIEAAALEKPLQRSILPYVHAAFSIGALIGSGIAAVTSLAHIHVAWHLLGVAALITVARAFMIRAGTEFAAPPNRAGAELNDAKKPAARLAARAWLEPRTLLIGLVLLAASMSEGAAANWLNPAVVEGWGTVEAVGAAAYGTFVGSMLVVRLVGARLIDRFGRVAVLRASGACGFFGLAAFGLLPQLPFAWVGIVLWGFGAALAWPLATSAAADDPVHAPARVSVVSSFGSIASLSMPPVLGFLADNWGVRHALLVITVAMVISFLVAGQVRERHSL